MNINALDCTFRDGGYYNNWEFDIYLAQEYIRVMGRSGIEAIEIGFRSPGKKNFANATDEFIIDNYLVPGVKYFGVMVNTNDFSKDLFGQEDKSPINFVRAATHFKDIDLAERVCKELKELGYIVCCNLMQAANKTLDEIFDVAEKIQSWDAVDVLYLADSLGGMDGCKLTDLYAAIKTRWSGQTGFHAHNNKDQALGNSLWAVDIGVNWIDGTILGMGRGAGNTETEYLLTELGGYNVEEVYELVMKFLPLKEKYGWGPSLSYYLAAEYNIHPTYVQKILEYYLPPGALKAIRFLKDKETNFFNKKLYEESIKCVL